jgi:hypothetical protein
MPSTNPPILEIARRLAVALDAEDYETARACLAVECIYHSPDGVLVGPDAIISSYRENGASGRARFEQVQFESLVESAGPTEALITYTDRVRLGGMWHHFRCRQLVRMGGSGLVDEIRHEELPGERERLHQFEAQAGRARQSTDDSCQGPDDKNRGPGSTL